MSDLAALERRIQVLEDTEAIRKLKFKYWWTLDNKQWDAFADCMTEDLEFDVGGGPSTGRDELVPQAVDLLQPEQLESSHHGHQSDITITSETTATGIWVLNDELTDKVTGVEFNGRGYYEEEYRKDASGWKISKMKLWYSSAKSNAKQYGSGIGQFMGLLRTSRDI